MATIKRSYWNPLSQFITASAMVTLSPSPDTFTLSITNSSGSAITGEVFTTNANNPPSSVFASLGDKTFPQNGAAVSVLSEYTSEWTLDTWTAVNPRYVRAYVLLPGSGFGSMVGFSQQRITSNA